MLLSAGKAASASEPPPLREVASGVFLQPGLQEDWGPANEGRVANGGFVIGERCVAVVDPGGSPAAGAKLKAELRRVSKLPVCYVIDTHAHPDHVLGGSAFAAPEGPGEQQPAFVGHQRLAAALAARGPYYLNALKRDFGPAYQAGAVIVPPGLLVADRQELDLGGRTLDLVAWPTSHTDADLTVFDRRTGTLWAGDLWFDGHLPVVDGKLNGWLQTLQRLAVQPVKLAIPGHGNPSGNWPQALAPERRYLESLRADVRAAIRSGASLAATVERVKPDPGSQWLLVEQFHRRNVTAAFAELEWE